MKRFLGGAATIAVCAGLFGVVGTGTAAAAPLDIDKYERGDPAYGHIIGSVSFYNRDVVVQGTVKSHTTGCAQALFEIYETPSSTPKVQTRTACGRGTGTSTDYNFTVDLGPGGAAFVTVTLQENTTGKWEQVPNGWQQLLNDARN
ncbi:hypothetical protein ACFFS2_17915 [Streptomyces aurantiacus]|uniref:Secreted protein n=1 Tax=Streptomyces aurantiacus TaxID=47760 RepID=A0A7G1P905_9ACTN|nr:hypothetical protein [Streptomyces aurantiacus]BCL31878.1 hypothetical protein GCM10017557_67370 [Streptomyces aurantiacus]